MNARLLVDASRSDLCRLADDHGVDYSEETTREELAEMILEAYEESRREHQATNNHPVRVEETKYQARLVEPPAPVLDQEVDTPTNGRARAEYLVPDTYNETRAVLILRDPMWAFAYWDVRDSEVREYRSRDDFNGLALRVHLLPDAEVSIGKSVSSFDIPVGLLDNRWYLHLPEQEAYYAIELLAILIDREERLAISNVIFTPRGGLADDDHGGDSTEQILAFAGIHDLDVRPVGTHLPQRILSLVDEELMFH